MAALGRHDDAAKGRGIPPPPPNHEPPFHYETRLFRPDFRRFLVSERNKMAVFCQLLAFGTGFAYVWA
jgi:hypothetical protein